MATVINEVDKLEILTLQDNYVDLLAGDSGEILQRAKLFKPRDAPLGGWESITSIFAEHGFSTLVTTTTDGVSRSILFDFGLSPQGAALNAETLDVDLTGVEALTLSHGHSDHAGGLNQLVGRVGKRGLELVLHSAAFRSPRYLKIPPERKVYLPSFTQEKAQDAGVRVTETKEPYPLLGGELLFLGEILRGPLSRGGCPTPSTRWMVRRGGIPSRTTPESWSTFGAKGWSSCRGVPTRESSTRWTTPGR